MKTQGLSRIILLLVLIAGRPDAFLFGQKDQWETYIAAFEKGPGTVTFNLSMHDRFFEAPYPGIVPHLVAVTVYFSRCNEHGLPLREELPSLYEIADSLSPLLMKGQKAQNAGTFTCQCARNYYYYVSDTAGVRQNIIRLFRRSFPTYPCEVLIRPDAEWHLYNDFLYPTDEILQYIKNEKIIAGLKKNGDNLSAPRKVEHWLFFKTKEGRDDFIRFARTRSFVVEAEEKSTGDFPWTLLLSRDDIPEITIITPITLELAAKAAEMGGYYDGWETSVVKP